MGAATLALTGARPPRTQMKSISSGAGTIALGTCTMSSSYATNGDTGDWGALSGLISQQKSAEPSNVFPFPAAGYIPVWDATNKKMLVYQQSAATSALTQVNSTTDLHTVVFPCLLFI